MVAKVVATVIVERKKKLAPYIGFVGMRLDSTNVVGSLAECEGVKYDGLDCFGGCVEIIMPGRVGHSF